jgi:hypothetical protein
MRIFKSYTSASAMHVMPVHGKPKGKDFANLEILKMA